MANGDNGFGYYVLQTYAEVAGLSPQEVETNYRNRYTEDGITTLGQMGRLVNFAALKNQFQKVVDNYNSISPERIPDPFKADLYDALMTVGGQLPSVTSNIVDAVDKTASQVASVSVSAFKGVTIIAAVALAIYIGVETGVFKSVASRRS